MSNALFRLNNEGRRASCGVRKESSPFSSYLSQPSVSFNFIAFCRSSQSSMIFGETIPTFFLSSFTKKFPFYQAGLSSFGGMQTLSFRIIRGVSFPFPSVLIVVCEKGERKKKEKIYTPRLSSPSWASLGRTIDAVRVHVYTYAFRKGFRVHTVHPLCSGTSVRVSVFL